MGGIAGLGLAVAAAWGQDAGAQISGTVVDSSGAGLPAASVLVRNLETGAERRLTTDNSGHYAAPGLAAGRYRVESGKAGFAAQEKSPVTLVTAEHEEVNFTLSIGEIRQVVTVEETPSPVALTNEGTAGLVTERQVKDLPLNGRSYDGLLTLNPAVINYSSQRSGNIGTANSAVGNMFAVAGRRPQENLFLLNGIEYTGASANNNTPGGTSGQLLGVEAVREFNVLADTYGAEYGKRSGGQVSIVTASGTNQLHGSVYEFLRNNALDARNFFDQGSAPQFQRNQFGASLGGPIRKDKLFLFGNFEGYRQRLALSNVALVPDDNARRGFLPEASGRLQFAGLTPQSAELLKLWPQQNGPTLGGGVGVAYNNPLQKIDERFGTVRLDWNRSERDNVSAVYTIDDSLADTPTVNPLSTIYETLREQVGSVQHQHVFSPRVLHTARLGYSRAGYFFTGNTTVDTLTWIAGKPIGAIVIGGGTALNAASQISLAGTNAGSNLAAVRNLYTYDDRVSVTVGIHQVEAGGWFQRLQANDNLAQYQYGQASFSNLQSFLTGRVSTFTAIPNPTPLGWRSAQYAGFVQDAIRLRPNLSVRLGFRFEGTNGWNEVAGRASNYVFDTNGVMQTQPRIASSAFTVNRARFLPEPRVGLSWDPTGKSSTIIRAGFGLYRALFDNLDYRLDQTAPFNATVTLRNVALSSLNFAAGAVPQGGLISPSGIQPDAYTPTVATWSFKVEQRLPAATALSVAYVGSHGYHQILSKNANEPAARTLPDGRLYYAPNSPNVNPALANTTTWFSEGVSSYQSLQTDVHRRFANGFEWRGVYTFAKNLDNGTAWNSSVASNAPGFVMYPGNPKLDYGLATTDVRHSASVNALYELPFGAGKHWGGSLSGWRARAAGGWSIGSILTARTGLPFTPQLGFNPTNNGDTRNPIRPSWNQTFRGSVVTGDPNRYFDPNAFAVPANGTYGDAGRNVLTGPGLNTLDVTAAKNTTITERLKLQFRAELFNVLNHTNFTTPNAVVFTSATGGPAPTAGVITATATTSRQVQFGVKVLW